MKNEDSVSIASEKVRSSNITNMTILSLKSCDYGVIFHQRYRAHAVARLSVLRFSRMDKRKLNQRPDCADLEHDPNRKTQNDLRRAIKTISWSG
jgi:hypothetical protein